MKKSLYITEKEFKILQQKIDSLEEIFEKNPTMENAKIFFDTVVERKLLFHDVKEYEKDDYTIEYDEPEKIYPDEEDEEYDSYQQEPISIYGCDGMMMPSP